MLFLFTQSKCHINIVLNWFTFLMVQSMEIVSEEHAEKLFILIIVCKYRDYLVQIQRLSGEDTNARSTLCPQPKQFLYFALSLQSHNKYIHHEDTVNVHSLTNWKHFTSNTTFSRTPLSKRAMCVF